MKSIRKEERMIDINEKVISVFSQKVTNLRQNNFVVTTFALGKLFLK